jgi:hypothetical protein
MNAMLQNIYEWLVILAGGGMLIVFTLAIPVSVIAFVLILGWRRYNTSGATPKPKAAGSEDQAN